MTSPQGKGDKLSKSRLAFKNRNTVKPGGCEFPVTNAAKLRRMALTTTPAPTANTHHPYRHIGEVRERERKDKTM